MSPLTAVLVLSVAATVVTLLLGVNTYLASQLDPKRPADHATRADHEMLNDARSQHRTAA